MPTATANRAQGRLFEVEDEDGLYTSHEVCKITGLTYRQLDYLVARHRMVPQVPPQGSGTRTKYRRSQVLTLRAAEPLWQRGMRPNLYDLEEAIVEGAKGVWVLPDGTISRDWPPEAISTYLPLHV